MKHKNIQIEATSQVFSSYSGLNLVEKIYKELNIKKRIKKALPPKDRNKAPSQIGKFKSLLFSFILGGESLSDLDDFRKDILFKELTEGAAATTVGEFLKSFGERHIEVLQDLLLTVVYEIREALFPGESKFILSMDSTPHEHYAKLMEGMALNYKGMWCLDSQNAYDQYGFSYLFDLRPGSTHSAKEAEKWVHKIFSKCPPHLEKWFRADSAYAKYSVLEALQVKKIKFTIVMRENWAKSIRRIHRNLLEWKKTDLEFFGSRDCEVAQVTCPFRHLGDLRVVFVRKKKTAEEIAKVSQMDMLTQQEYDPEELEYKYYSIVTNIDSSEMNIEEVFEFYRGRANCENFIKEQKYGFDFLNFPCKRLRANKVFGVIGSFAHNLTRVLSFSMPQKWKSVRDKKTKEIKRVKQLGYFAKKVRMTCLKIPGQVVRSARKTKLRMNRLTKEVLDKVMENLLKVVFTKTAST